MTRTTPLSTTDAIMEYRKGDLEGIVLILRRNPPHGWALPGGFHEVGLTLEENAIKEVREETGLRFRITNPGKPWTYSAPDRDQRGHIIAHVFYGRGTGKLQHGDDAGDVQVYSFKDLRKLLRWHDRGMRAYRPCAYPDEPLADRKTEYPLFAFDHAQILKDYLDRRGTLDR